MDPQNWTTSRRAGVHESKGPHVKNCSKPISSVVSVSWIINCPFLTSVIHAQNRRYNELSHLGTLVRSPKLENEHHLWQTGFPIQLHLAHLSSLRSPGPQPKPCAPIPASSSLVLEPASACLALTATTKPLTFLPEHGLRQDVAFSLWSRQFDFFNVTGCAFLPWNHRLLWGCFFSFLKAYVPAEWGHVITHILPPQAGLCFLFGNAACHPTVCTPKAPAGWRVFDTPEPASWDCIEPPHNTGGHGHLSTATERWVATAYEGLDEYRVEPEAKDQSSLYD